MQPGDPPTQRLVWHARPAPPFPVAATQLFELPPWGEVVVQAVRGALHVAPVIAVHVGSTELHVPPRLSLLRQYAPVDVVPPQIPAKYRLFGSPVSDTA